MLPESACAQIELVYIAAVVRLAIVYAKRAQCAPLSDDSHCSAATRDASSGGSRSNPSGSKSSTGGRAENADHVPPAVLRDIFAALAAPLATDADVPPVTGAPSAPAVDAATAATNATPPPSTPSAPRVYSDAPLHARARDLARFGPRPLACFLRALVRARILSDQYYSAKCSKSTAAGSAMHPDATDWLPDLVLDEEGESEGEDESEANDEARGRDYRPSDGWADGEGGDGEHSKAKLARFVMCYEWLIATVLACQIRVAPQGGC